jgi:hypothetical protein
MKYLKFFIILLFISSCAASNFSDPTRPDIRKQAKRIQQDNLRQYGDQ